MDDPLAARKAERQILLAELAPTVQHAANNMLTVLSGTADILRRTAKDEAAAKRAERLSDAAQRLEMLIRGYLTLARRPVPQQETGDVALLLVRLAPVIELFLPRGVRLETEALPDLPPVRADWAALDAGLLAVLRRAAPRLQPVLRLVAAQVPEGVTLRIEGLPADTPADVLDDVARQTGARPVPRSPSPALLLPRAEG